MPQLEILSAVAVAGSALSRYCSGEITLEDCVVELHKNAATLAASTTGSHGSGRGRFHGSRSRYFLAGPMAVLGAMAGPWRRWPSSVLEDVVLAPYYNAKAARKLEDRRTAAFNRVSAAMEAAQRPRENGSMRCMKPKKVVNMKPSIWALNE